MNLYPARLAIAFAAVVAASAASADVVLFEDDNFGGRSYASSNSVSNLNSAGFNDRASSIVVRSGQWQLCSDAYFRGTCVTLGPGRYPSLGAMGLNDQVSSVRDLGWTPDQRGGWQGGNGNSGNNGNNGNNRWGNGGNWGSGSRAVLYSGSNLTGQAYVVSAGGVTNLDRAGFNDRARSLRVESGYWIFCSDANYEGDCHTYGPGDYASLPSGQKASISSGRRISANYPYQSSPNWNNSQSGGMVDKTPDNANWRNPNRGYTQQ